MLLSYINRFSDWLQGISFYHRHENKYKILDLQYFIEKKE